MEKELVPRRKTADGTTAEVPASPQLPGTAQELACQESSITEQLGGGGAPVVGSKMMPATTVELTTLHNPRDCHTALTNGVRGFSAANWQLAPQNPYGDL